MPFVSRCTSAWKWSGCVYPGGRVGRPYDARLGAVSSELAPAGRGAEMKPSACEHDFAATGFGRYAPPQPPSTSAELLKPAGRTEPLQESTATPEQPWHRDVERR
jgi:hypothetical protein